jgi:hypothetical protein
MPMLNINASSLIETGAISKDQNVSLVHRQAWMQSLERAGLVDSLRQIHVMTNSSSKASPLFDSEQPATSPSINEERPCHEEDAPSFDRGKVVENFRSHPAPSNPLAMAQPSDTTFEIVRLMTSMANDIQKEPAYISKDKLSGADNEALVTSKSQIRYLEQNVLMLNVNTGIELWIRDTTLTKSKLVEMLKVVRQSMGGLGVSLVKVVLNGQEILSLQEKSNESETSLI